MHPRGDASDFNRESVTYLNGIIVYVPGRAPHTRSRRQRIMKEP